MPIYEYECSQCRNVFEDWCKHVADGDVKHFCPDCNAPAARIISHTSFTLKGGGWYATEYGNLKNTSNSDKPAAKTDAAPAADNAPAAESKPVAETKAAPASS